MQTQQQTQTGNAALPLVITRATKSDVIAIVPSQSRPGHYHTVSLNLLTGKSQCTCPSGEHGRDCYHQKSLRLTCDEQEASAPSIKTSTGNLKVKPRGGCGRVCLHPAESEDPHADLLTLHGAEHALHVNPRDMSRHEAEEAWAEYEVERYERMTREVESSDVSQPSAMGWN